MSYAGTTTVTTTVTIAGMTCGHCVDSVSEQLGEIAGVEQVEVILETGDVTITSATPLDPADIESAVAEAGYHLV
jgi:copper chaperone CopZ